MKVVINNCYGGFGVSANAMKRLIAENSPLVRSFTVEEYYGKACSREVNLVDRGDGYFSESFLESVLHKEGRVYSLDRSDDAARCDPFLVRLVEEMGDAANGRFASLRIVEVPDDAEWYISEYDGNEHVAEKHRTWY
jgi:hypothetical protein